MSFFVKYVAYPDKIDEVRMELGSPVNYQIIQALEKVPLTEIEESQELPKEFEILFKVIDGNTGNVLLHKMTREELSDYIQVLKHILAQTK